MTAAPPRWHLHLGAHKTATTHLQEVLKVIGPGLGGPEPEGQGVQVVPPGALRRISLTRLRRREALLQRLGWPVGRSLRRAVLAAAPGRTGTLVLSDENLLGRLEDALHPVCYDGLGWRLRTLGAMAARDPVTVFLAIRRMDRFLPSIHAQTLRHRPPPQPFEALKARILATPPRWSEVAARIATALPGADIRIWRYEEYPGHERAVLSLLCGTDPGPVPEIPRPEATMTPTAARVAAIEAMPRTGDRAAWMAAVRATLSAPGAADEAPYRPFSAAESARLAALYDEDCAALAAKGWLVRF